MATVDWDALRQKLPCERTPEQFQARTELFRAFDPNGNGYLSLAEVDLGCRDILQLHELFECKPVLIRAFQTVKGVGNKRGKGGTHGPDYVERYEFRLLLVYLLRYFELWQMFSETDANKDRRVSYDEFEQALPKLVEWGAHIDDPRATFDAIDSNDGGLILFQEFADYAIHAGLDALNEEDFDDNNNAE